MFDNNDFPNGSAQCAISHETLILLRWLIEYHSEDLKNIIHKALHTGLKNALVETHAVMPEDSQESVVDFFHLLEFLLMQTSDEHSLSQASTNNLQPTIDQIDSMICDTTTVQSSIECATTALKDHPERSARELLFKELLKRWIPHKQQPLN